MRFNPHPARRPGATSGHGERCTASMREVFQSSPGQKAGCNADPVARLRYRCIKLVVSILTRPEGRVQRQPLASQSDRTGASLTVSILTRPEGRVQRSTVPQLEPLRTGRVSILTRPEGRVQHQHAMESRPGKRFILTRPSATRAWHRRGLATVSILTRPEGRVQRVGLSRPYMPQGSLRFNPHPARRPGATRRLAAPNLLRTETASFNPHPARRPGATAAPGAYGTITFNAGFNPHPARRPGATPQVLPRACCRTRQPVSILTRPEGRVQQL